MCIATTIVWEHEWMEKKTNIIHTNSKSLLHWEERSFVTNYWFFKNILTH